MSQIFFLSLLQGFGLSLSLIVAIGAQNAFVLRQGLKRQYVFVVACMCSLGDVCLISLGVGGLGIIFTTFPLLTTLATWGGAVFLLVYGFHSFQAALSTKTLNEQSQGKEPGRLRETVLAVLAFTFLNPHTFLDTVVLIGSVSAHYQNFARFYFALGAMLASCTWFFSLAYGARWL